MTSTVQEPTAHLLSRLRQVQANLGLPVDTVVSGGTRFADVLDSMGLAEFIMLLARDYETTPAAIEELAGRQFDTVAALAAALHAGGFTLPRCRATATPSGSISAADLTLGDLASPQGYWTKEAANIPVSAWLAATTVRLPQMVQPAEALDPLLQRPAGWLRSHAGIEQRRVWADEDPLAAAAETGRDCLEQASLTASEVGALLTVSEAPPLPLGLAAALHHRLGLRPFAPALEVGGACTGFLAALWLARPLVAANGPVLLLSVEAPSQFLRVEPGPAGESAALFGDAAAACLVTGHGAGTAPAVLVDVTLSADGSAGHLIRVEQEKGTAFKLHLEGTALAGRAVRAMAEAVRELTRRHGLDPADLAAVVAHGGNGRLPPLLGRELGLPADRVWSETSRTGNLGSASLPVAWATRRGNVSGFVAWTAVGAGLTWGAALTHTAAG